MDMHMDTWTHGLMDTWTHGCGQTHMHMEGCIHGRCTHGRYTHRDAPTCGCTDISTERCTHGYTWRNMWMLVQAQTHKGTTKKMHKEEQRCTHMATHMHTHNPSRYRTQISRDVHTHTSLHTGIMHTGMDVSRDACSDAGTHGCLHTHSHRSHQCLHTYRFAHGCVGMHGQLPRGRIHCPAPPRDTEQMSPAHKTQVGPGIASPSPCILGKPAG